MGNLLDIDATTLQRLALVAGFVLPGAISMYVYGLKVPQKEFELKNRIAEAICFSLLNFIVVGLPVPSALALPLVRDWFVLRWLVMVIAFILVPIVWPFIVVAILQFAERRRWIRVRANTAWDDFFGRQTAGCWIQVVLNDDKVIGGRYGSTSFASSWPDPGHLYLQELWAVDTYGNFQYRAIGKPGVLLRPSDYKLLRVYLSEA